MPADFCPGYTAPAFAALARQFPDESVYALSSFRVEWGPIYEVLHDEDAQRHGQLRVIDESGDDYLYPREYFQPVDLSPALNRLVRGNGGRRRQVARTVRRAGTIRPTR